MKTEVVLVPMGNEDSYDPEVTLEYDLERQEMYVSLGEEAAGMIENVPEGTWQRIVERLV